MPRSNQIILIILAASIALYGGVKGYLYYKAQEGIEKFSNQLTLFGELEYDAISTSLDGSLTYKELKFTTHPPSDVITIEAIHLETPGINYLLDTISGIGAKNDLPERLQITIKGLKFELDGYIMQELDRTIEAQNSAMATEQSLCAGHITFGPTQYRAIGYNSFTSDITLGYKFNRHSASVESEIHWSVRDMGQFDLLSRIANIDSMSPTDMLMPPPPRLSKMELRYQDLSYGKRVNAYCASLSKMSLADYIKAETTLSDEEFAATWGVIPSPALRAAYNSFISEPSTVRVIIWPPELFDVENLTLYTLEDIPSVLNLALFVNNIEVKDLSFKTVEEPAGETRSRLQLLLHGETPLVTPSPKKEILAPLYHRIALKNVKKYIGKKVRVHTKRGIVKREGWLTGVTTDELQIEQHVFGGKLAMSVAFKNISYVEAFFAKN